MKTKEIVRTYGVDGAAFERWLRKSGYAYKSGMMGGLELTDGQNVDEIVLAFKQYLVQQKERTAREASERDRAAGLKQEAMDAMLVTTGFNFEGYQITRYAGYVSGDDAVQFQRTSGVFGRSTGVGDGLMSSMSQLRQNALTQVKEAAYALECNAVIGVDFDYLTVDPKSSGVGNNTNYHPYVFGVTASGTAIVVEQLPQA
jgi:Uncharacterized conserved protein